MLERLFASPALYATLALFFDYPHDILYPRLIARRTGADIKGVLRELRTLTHLGLIRVRSAGRGRRYTLNEAHPCHEGLRILFDATRGERMSVRHAKETRHWGDLMR